MAKVRTALSRLVGGIQCVLGGLSSVFVFLVYASSSVRDALALTSEEVYLYMLLFAIFAVLSISSGLLLLSERK